MTVTVKTLAEDLASIGLGALDNHLLGISESEDDNAVTDPEKPQVDESDLEQDDDDDSPGEFSEDVQKAATVVYMHVRPQIDESLIDYDVDQFESDLISAIATMIEAKADSLDEDELDMNAVSVDVSEAVADLYNELAGASDEEEAVDENQARAKSKQGPRGKTIQGVGRNIRIGAKGRQVKVRGAADVMQSRKGAMKRTASVLAKKRRVGRMKRNTGAYKATARKSAVKHRMYASEAAIELAGLLELAEGTQTTTEPIVDPIRAALAEAFDRVEIVAAMLGDFFESNGTDEDVEIAGVLDVMIESVDGLSESVLDLSEAEFDLKGSMERLQAFSKVIARAEEEYAQYELADDEGNVYEMEGEAVGK